MSKPQEIISSTAINDTESDDIATIIGFVLNLEYERNKKLEDPTRITMARNTAHLSHWGLLGRLRSMPVRSFHG